jgi:hypothetical protein
MALPIWHPPPLDLEDIERREKAAAKGAPSGLWIGVQPEQGVPAPPEAMHQIGGGVLEKAFVAQYHRLLGESGLADAPWAHTGVLPDEAHQRAVADARREDARDRHDRAAPRLSENSLLDGVLKEGLNLDLVTGAGLGMAVAIDELHVLMLEHKARRVTGVASSDLPGAEALTIWIPDFTAVPWNEIIELHDHDAIGAFRAKLAEAEEEASNATPEERKAVLAQIGLRESALALEKYFPSLKGSAFSIGLDLAVGFTPLAPLSAAVTATREIAELQRAHGEWVSIYLSLQRATRATSRRA